MGDYFQPRRRKVGVVLLLFACVVMAARIRSQSEQDFVQLQPDGFLLLLKSYDGAVDLRLTILIGNLRKREIDSRITTSTQARSFFIWRSMELSEYYEEIDSSHLRWGGFQFASGPNSNEWNARLKIPYWTIVVPLTLFSGGLLFSSPRTKQTDFASIRTDEIAKTPRSDI